MTYTQNPNMPKVRRDAAAMTLQELYEQTKSERWEILTHKSCLPITTRMRYLTFGGK